MYISLLCCCFFFFFQAEDGIRDLYVTGVQTCALPISGRYTVYPSLDGGDTFNSLGCTLPDSGWCRPASDHRTGVHLLYAVCGNDGGSEIGRASCRERV